MKIGKNYEIKVLLKGGMHLKGKLKDKNEIGIFFIEFSEVYSCKTKKTENENRILFIPWNSICYFEIL